MKKSLMILSLIFLLIDCSKNQATNVLIGTWISSNKNETLNFVDVTNFYKADSGFQTLVHFNYKLGTDSISIQYDGPLQILVMPRNYKYELNNNTLIIDLRNGCYGFNSQLMSYTRK